MSIGDTLKCILPSEVEIYNITNTEKDISYCSIRFSYNKINVVIDIEDCDDTYWDIDRFIAGVKEFKIEKYNSKYRYTTYLSALSGSIANVFFLKAVVANDTFTGIRPLDRYVLEEIKLLCESSYFTIDKYLNSIEKEVINKVTYYSITPNFTVLNKVYQNMHSIPRFDIGKFHEKEVFIDVEEFNNIMRGLLSGTGYNIILDIKKFIRKSRVDTIIVKGNKALQITNRMPSFFLLCTESQLIYYIGNIISRAEEKILDINTVPEGCILISEEEEYSAFINIVDVEYRGNLGVTVIEIESKHEEYKNTLCVKTIKKDNLNNFLAGDMKSFISKLKVKYTESTIKIDNKTYCAYSYKGALKFVMRGDKVINDRRIFKIIKSAILDILEKEVKEKERSTTEYNVETNNESFSGEYYPIEDGEE